MLTDTQWLNQNTFELLKETINLEEESKSSWVSNLGLENLCCVLLEWTDTSLNILMMLDIICIKIRI